MQLSLSAGSLSSCYRLTLILKLSFCCLFAIEEAQHCKLGCRQAHRVGVCIQLSKETSSKPMKIQGFADA